MLSPLFSVSTEQPFEPHFEPRVAQRLANWTTVDMDASGYSTCQCAHKKQQQQSFSTFHFSKFTIFYL